MPAVKGVTTIEMFPWAPMEAELRRRGCVNAIEMAELLGVSCARVYQARTIGSVSWISADRLACGLGVHPSAIWGDAWWARYLSDAVALELVFT